MSYISTADLAVFQPSAKLRDLPMSGSLAPHLSGASPVGPALEMVLMIVTNAAVSLVFCTAVAGALLH